MGQRASYQNCEIVEISSHLGNLWNDLGRRRNSWKGLLLLSKRIYMANEMPELLSLWTLQNYMTVCSSRSCFSRCAYLHSLVCVCINCTTNASQLKFVAVTMSICTAGGRHCKESSFSTLASQGSSRLSSKTCMCHKSREGRRSPSSSKERRLWSCLRSESVVLSRIVAFKVSHSAGDGRAARVT